jgi:hypothetical protein
MQEYPLVSFADLKSFAHLFRNPALEVAEGDHHPLAVG